MKEALPLNSVFCYFETAPFVISVWFYVKLSILTNPFFFMSHQFLANI